MTLLHVTGDRFERLKLSTIVWICALVPKLFLYKWRFGNPFGLEIVPILSRDFKLACEVVSLENGVKGCSNLSPLLWGDAEDVFRVGNCDTITDCAELLRDIHTQQIERHWLLGLVYAICPQSPEDGL